MACLSMWHKNVKASPALLILSVTYLFDFVAGGKKEGGNSFFSITLVFPLQNENNIHNLNPTEKKISGK